MENLFISPLNGATFVRNMFLSMSNSSEYLGCDHERHTNSLPMLKAFLVVSADFCFELLVPPGEHGPCYSGQLVSVPTDHQSSVTRTGMPCLTDLDRACATGQLQAGVFFKWAPVTSAIEGQVQIEYVKDSSRTGHPKKTALLEDNFLILSALWNSKQFPTDLESLFVGRCARRLSAQSTNDNSKHYGAPNRRRFCKKVL